jgi:hypothetical protein
VCEVSESGLPIGALARPQVEGDDVGVMMGWKVKAGGEVVPPSTEQSL